MKILNKKRKTNKARFGTKMDWVCSYRYGATQGNYRRWVCQQS